MDRKNVTLRDVAALAGVSVSTVSRLLNNKPSAVPIAKETRLNVLKVANELGYKPNRLARGLITSRTHNVGIHLPLLNPVNVRVDDRIPWGELMGFALVGALLEGIQTIAYPKNYEIHVYRQISREDPSGIRLTDISADFVDGLICALPVADKHYVTFAEDLGVPVVAISLYPPVHEIASVYIDSFSESYRLVREWINGGHRCIALFLPTSHDELLDRSHRLGCQRAMEEAGLSSDENLLVVEGSWDERKVRQRAEEILAHDPMPTAIYVGRADNAIEVLRTVQRNGLTCPDDVEIVVWCDDYAFEATQPRLSAIDVPFHILASESAKLLFDAVEGRTPKRRKFPVACTFRGRESTRPGLLQETGAEASLPGVGG